jgi:hypothetical protein
LYDYVFSGLLTHLPICYGFIDYRPGAHATIFIYFTVYSRGL